MNYDAIFCERGIRKTRESMLKVYVFENPWAGRVWKDGDVDSMIARLFESPSWQIYAKRLI